MDESIDANWMDGEVDECGRRTSHDQSKNYQRIERTNCNTIKQMTDFQTRMN